MRARQHGAALILILLLLVVGAGIVFVSHRKSAEVELEAQRRTAAALAQAKQALLGYAAGDANRPGSLPCADIDNDGDLTPGIDFSCGSQVVGRLPWKLLGLPDLRDGSGERLWYAVSPKFRAFLSPSVQSLNTTVAGQITLRDLSGMILYDAGATPAAGVIAVIIAPGSVLTRLGATASQDRSCNGGGGCTPDLRCQPPYQSVALCNPVNYLDAVTFEDNADFVAGSSSNGLVHGGEPDASGGSMFNDRMLAITQSDLRTVMTLRMARELAALNPPGVSGYSPGSIAGLAKPAVWIANDWDDAVDMAVSGVSSSAITLKFKNCAIVYTISGPNAVTLSPRAC